MPKKSARKASVKKTKAKKPKTFLEKYLAGRDKFYRDHPNSKVLLGLFVIAVAIMIGKIYYKQQWQGAISFFLANEEGIHYIPD